MSVTGLSLLGKKLLLKLLNIGEILLLDFMHLFLVLYHALEFVMLQLCAQ